MRLPLRHVLLPTFTAVLLITASSTGWYLTRRAPIQVEGTEDILPVPPPAPPRLTEDPIYPRCLDLLSDDAQAALALAEAWNSQGGGDGALHCSALALLVLGESQQAAVALESLATQSRATSSARAMLYGQASQAWMTAGRPESAHKAAALALALSPTSSDLLVDRGAAAMALGRFNDALADATQATRHDPERAEAWVLRAATLRRLDHAQEALRDVERALGLAPDNSEALLERGILRQLNGDLEGARADWASVLDLAPESSAANLAQQNLALSEAGPSRR